MKIRQHIYLIIFFVISTTLSGNDEFDIETNANAIEPVSSLRTSFTADEEKNVDTGLSINLETQKYYQLFASYIHSRGSDITLDTRQYGFGVSTSPYEIFGIRTDYNDWGKSGALKSQVYRSELFFSLTDWYLAFSPQFSKTTIRAEVLPQNQFDVYAIGQEFTLSYYGLENWSLGIRYFENRFGDSPLKFLSSTRRNLILRSIPPSARSLVSSLEKQHQAFTVGYFFSRGSLNYEWYTSESFINNQESTIHHIVSSISLSPSFEIDFSVSRLTYSGINEEIFSISSGLTYFW